ncbi:MAG: hypothetical protein WA982_15530 [Rubrobacteraceae bacterium]
MQSVSEEVRGLERVRYVTENYEQLQGLKNAPVGLMVLFSGALMLFPSSLRSFSSLIGGNLYLLYVVLIAMVLLYFAMGSYYERRFGWVQTFSMERQQIVAAIILIIVLVVVGSANLAFQPPIHMIWLAWGVALTVVYWRERRFRAHYVVIGILVCGVSFLPLLGISQTGSTAYETGGLMAFLGILYVVGGILDHFLLVRTMKSLPEEDDGRAV